MSLLQKNYCDFYVFSGLGIKVLRLKSISYSVFVTDGVIFRVILCPCMAISSMYMCVHESDRFICRFTQTSFLSLEKL